MNILTQRLFISSFTGVENNFKDNRFLAHLAEYRLHRHCGDMSMPLR